MIVGVLITCVLGYCIIVVRKIRFIISNERFDSLYRTKDSIHYIERKIRFIISKVMVISVMYCLLGMGRQWCHGYNCLRRPASDLCLWHILHMLRRSTSSRRSKSNVLLNWAKIYLIFVWIFIRNFVFNRARMLDRRVTHWSGIDYLQRKLAAWYYWSLCRIIR